MVGKPNLSMPNEFNLDRERTASMADEGGWSGAEMETQDVHVQATGTAPIHRLPIHENFHSAPEIRSGLIARQWPWLLAGAAVVAAGSAIYFAYRRRAEASLQPE